MFRVAALSVFLMFFGVLLFFREPRRIAKLRRTSPGAGRQKLHDGAVTNPRFMLFLTDLHRLLDRVLAGVHHPAAVRAQLHQSRRLTPSCCW